MRKFSATLSTLFIGHTVNFFTDEFFDFVLYPAALAYFGLIRGAILMWALSFLVCFGLVVFYNWSKRDWLGIELVKDTLNMESSSLFIRVLAWANHKGRWLVLLILSILTDPFISVVYMRKESRRYQKMDKKDWKVFIISFVIANAWWTFAMFTGVTIIKQLYIYIQSII